MSPLRPGRTRERSRAQALELAGQVAAEARAPGSDFAKLVERYSDSPDAAQAGDFGVWSTHSPKHRGFILQAIAAVPLGGITDPVDSNEGFQVLRRTAADAREHLAADAPVQAALVRLPTPSEPNLDDVLRSAHGPGLAHSLQLLRQTLFPTAPAEPARRALGELLQTAADDMSRAAPDERPAVLARFWTGAASILPEPEVQRLRAHVFAFARQQLMQD